MEFQSVNHIEDFEFHDAFMSFVSFDNDCLTVSAKNLNIRKGTLQNQFTTDMEIYVATICFDGFRLCEYEPDYSWEHDENGTLYTDESRTVITGEAAKTLFFANLKHGTTILGLGVLESNQYYLDGIGESPFFC